MPALLAPPAPAPDHARERAYDLALGFPTLDVTELKQQLAEGGNAHDLVPKMLWAFKEAYQLVTRSTADGSSFRELMMSINAQQPPQQAPMPPPSPCPQAISRRTRAAMTARERMKSSLTSVEPCSASEAAPSSPKNPNRSRSAAAPGARDDTPLGNRPVLSVFPGGHSVPHRSGIARRSYAERGLYV